MSKAKTILKNIWANVWETIKSSFLAVLFYCMASTICFMGTLNSEWTGQINEGLNSSRVMWIVIASVIAVGYNAIVAYAHGSRGYEMLVSGNMKRLSSQRLGSDIKISTHKELQEYRAWKGFAMGGVAAFFTLLFGILMGIKGSSVNAVLVHWAEAEEGASVASRGIGVLFLVSMLCSGWSLLPFIFVNATGAGVSYFYSCLFALLPIAVSGFLYIAGAYGKRGKTVKAQREADLAAAAEQNKPKKINYGGLPGTKPKKKK